MSYLLTYLLLSKIMITRRNWKVHRKVLFSLDEVLKLHRQIIIDFFLKTFKKMGSTLYRQICEDHSGKITFWPSLGVLKYTYQCTSSNTGNLEYSVFGIILVFHHSLILSLNLPTPNSSTFQLCFLFLLSSSKWFKKWWFFSSGPLPGLSLHTPENLVGTPWEVRATQLETAQASLCG